MASSIRSNPQKLNAAFWRWFKESKVVDEHGDPLVVYHGTDKDFSIFQEKHSGRNTNDEGGNIAVSELGHFFTDSKKAAADAAEWSAGSKKTPRTVSVFLRIENPFIPEPSWKGRTYLNSSFRVIERMALEFGGGRRLRAHLKKIGHDGVILYDSHDSGFKNQFVVFDPKQIKSATGNDGTWDADDPDIRSNPRSNPEFWGKAGAGILFFDPKKKEFMLTLRSSEVQEPGTFGIPGGSCSGEHFSDGSEDVKLSEEETFDCAVRECREELGYFPEAYEAIDKIVFRKNKFTYTTFILAVPPSERRAMDKEIELNWENDSYDWDTATNWLTKSDLHFGARHVLEDLLK